MEKVLKRRVVVSKTYQGAPCRKYGHTERYVKSGHCVVCMKGQKEKWVVENLEKHKVYQKKWHDENTEKHKAHMQKYKKENPALYAHHSAKRRAMKKQQTPKWADMDKIKEIFLNCPEGYEVDHKHPLSKGGLHVDYNLQAIPKSENRRKGTKIL